MKLNKYSASKDGSTVVGSFADRGGSGGGSSSSSTTSSSSSSSGRILWGQVDNGDDITGNLHSGGNIYVGPMEFDQDEKPVPPSHQFPSESGNLFADKSVASPEVYGNSLFLDYEGKKTNVLSLLANLVMPVGSIIMYDGRAALPENWAVCDGNNGTPNLKDRFIKGVTAKADVGKTGGSSSVTIPAEALPSHSHTATTAVDVKNENDFILPEAYGSMFVPLVEETLIFGAPNISPDGTDTIAGINGHGENVLHFAELSEVVESGRTKASATASTSVANSGQGKPFTVEPPYYSLIFIMRIK